MPECAHPRHRDKRSRNRIHEDRKDRPGTGISAVEDLHRLHGTMIYFHVPRDGDVAAVVEDELREVGRDVFGDVEIAGERVVVAGPMSPIADAERRHQVVEEAVEMVGAEIHNEFRIERLDEIACSREGVIYGRFHLRGRGGMVEQWAVGHAQQSLGHRRWLTVRHRYGGAGSRRPRC